MARRKSRKRISLKRVMKRAQRYMKQGMSRRQALKKAWSVERRRK